MTIPNTKNFELAMDTKLRANKDKRMIPVSTLERHLTQQYSKYYATGDKKHLVNIANYCAMLWNKKA